MKEFLKSPKKTAILGLVGGVLMLMSFVMTLIGIHFEVDIFIILSKLYVAGIIIYFPIVLLNLYKKKGNIKIANYMLLVSLVVSVIVNVVFIYGTVINKAIYLIVFTIIIAYLYGLLLKEHTFNNKIFAIVMIIYVILNFISMLHDTSFTIYVMIYLLLYMGYLFIIPYFYEQYYDTVNLQRKNDISCNGEIAPLGVRIVSLLFPIVGAIIYAVNIKNSPRYAKSCGVWALCGFGIGFIAICLGFSVIF